MSHLCSILVSVCLWMFVYRKNHEEFYLFYRYNWVIFVAILLAAINLVYDVGFMWVCAQAQTYMCVCVCVIKMARGKHKFKLNENQKRFNWTIPPLFFASLLPYPFWKLKFHLEHLECKIVETWNRTLSHTFMLTQFEKLPFPIIPCFEPKSVSTLDNNNNNNTKTLYPTQLWLLCVMLFGYIWMQHILACSIGIYNNSIQT